MSRLRDTAETIAKAAPVPVPATALALADERERKLAEIQASKVWSAEHKARLIAELDDSTRAGIDRHAEAAIAEANRELDQAEGRILASVRFDVPSLPAYASPADKIMHAGVVRAAEAERRAVCQDLVGAIRLSDDPAEIEELADDVALYGHVTMTSRARREALVRVEALVRRAPEQNRSALQAVAARLRQADAEHRKAHPGPSRAKKAIQAQRENRQREITNFYTRHFARALGVHDKAAAAREDALAAARIRHD